jgi:L-methionine (R)-S-oxide reductase
VKKILGQNLSRQAKAARIAETIRCTGAWRWVGLYDVETRNGLVVNIAWSGPCAPEYPSFSITKGLTSRAVAGRRTINVGDVANDPDYLTALGSTRSEIIVPVLSETGDAVVGTIDVESERLNAFDREAQALLEQCAKALRDLWSEQTTRGGVR